MLNRQIAISLKKYSKELGRYFPLNCGNPLVAGQYTLPLHIILKYLKPKSSVLDWGCGTGHFSYLLLQENYDVVSYSYSLSDDVEIVRQKSKEVLNVEWKLLKATCQDPVKLPFNNETYEGIIAVGVLEHVRETGGDEHESLKELYRILKPGGYLCCFHFPNKYSWIEAASRALNKIHIHKHHHPYLYTQEEIHRLIQDTHFQLKEIGKYNVLPRRMLHVSDRGMWSHPALCAYEAFEKLCSFFFGFFSQNFYFVLQK